MLVGGADMIETFKQVIIEQKELLNDLINDKSHLYDIESPQHKKDLINQHQGKIWGLEYALEILSNT